MPCCHVCHSGGGHWSVVIGFSESHSIHNDPNCEADLVKGGSRGYKPGWAKHVQAARQLGLQI
jgi:hypothetical protein